MWNQKGIQVSGIGMELKVDITNFSMPNYEYKEYKK